MNKHLATLLLITSLFHGSHLLAQFTTPPQRISTPYGKVTVPGTPTHMPMYYGNPEAVYKLRIVLLNDSEIVIKTRINIEDSINSITWKKKGVKTTIVPSQTKQISRLDLFSDPLIGIPQDSCWLFLLDTGRIWTYSTIPEIDNPWVKYIKQGKDAPMLLLSKETLLPMITDNEKATKLAEKGKLQKAINVYNEN